MLQCNIFWFKKYGLALCVSRAPNSQAIKESAMAKPRKPEIKAVKFVARPKAASAAGSITRSPATTLDASAAPVLSAPQPVIAKSPGNAPAFKGSEAVVAQVRDAQENFRSAAEQSVAKTRESYARLKSEAETATTSIQTSFAAARASVETLNAKTFEALKTHTQSNFEHVKALLGATQPKDALALQTEFASKQLESFAAQAKDLSDHWQKIAVDAFQPMKSAMTRKFSI